MKTELENILRTLATEPIMTTDGLYRAIDDAKEAILDAGWIKVDEERIKEIIKGIDFNKNFDIVTGVSKAWFSLSGLKKLTSTITKALKQ